MTLSPLMKGVVIAVVHVAIIGTLGAKLLIDRERLPRVWVETAPVDPDLPIRGRYVQLALQIPYRDEVPPHHGDHQSITLDVTLAVEGDTLVAHRALTHRPWTVAVVRETTAGYMATLSQPVAFFIPEDVADPSIRPVGEVLWVEVTVPRKGPPRPIQLGVSRGGNPVEPLSLR